MFFYGKLETYVCGEKSYTPVRKLSGLSKKLHIEGALGFVSHKTTKVKEKSERSRVKQRTNFKGINSPKIS